MDKRVHFIFAALTIAGLSSTGQAWGRQNIVIGEMTIGYDFTDRTYDESDTRVTAIGPGASPAAVFFVTNDQEGDIRDYLLTPRIRFRSEGLSDLVEFSYAPTFTYDDIDDSSFVGQDFNLLAEKNVSQNWVIRATNSYFYGEDPVRDRELRTGAIIPGQETPDQPTVGAGPQEGDPQRLTELYGRQLYWRNDFSLSTDYTYAEDSAFGVVYNFGVLRDDEGEQNDDYTPYDRHEGIVRLSYRFNPHWQAVSDVGYVKGDFDDDTDVVAILPAADQVRTVDLSDDLQEYRGRLRMNYDLRVHDIFFGQYAYTGTDYDEELRQDAAIHDVTFGWDHDFSNQLRTTLAGGPSFVSFDRSSNETEYNAYAGVAWEMSSRSTLNASTSYGPEFDSFDGRRSGLTKTWRTELDYTHQFTPELQAVLSAGYENRDLDQPLDSGTVVVVIDETTLADAAATGDERFRYNEDSYDAGLTLSYNFLRWYTFSAMYRYYDYQSEVEQDYDEHRFLITLSAAKELFRW